MFLRLVTRLAIVIALAIAVGCGGNSTSSSNVVTSSSPYVQTDLVVGTGAVATVGNRVTVNYAGWLYDTSKPDGKGTQFDAANGSAFTLSSGNLIEGWVRGVAGMRVGGTRRLIIPPDLAYGSAGRSPSIPPNATLIFDITLVAVQ
jgi:FKBP-type peptidyl-prolyl cis-trans isomerase FkpA